MNLLINTVINCYSIILLIIIYYMHKFNCSSKESPPYKLYNFMILVTMVLLFFDILGRFDGSPDTIYSLLNSVGNFFIFFLHQVIPSLWFIYVYYIIYCDKKKLKKVYIPLLIINIFNAVLVIATQFNGWYYYIDVNNIYHRGPLCNISTLITLGIIITINIFLFLNRNKLEKRNYYFMLLFVLPPFIGIILQMYIYGIAFALNGAVLSLLTVFLHIQNRSIYTDYLTGISNRTKFEVMLNDKVDNSSPKRTFSLIMADIDNFKSINDTYGHDTGDNALKITAQLLKKSVRSKDYVFRFGGDEFCLILDVSDMDKLEKIVTRIKNQFKSFNETSTLSYRLSISIGHAVYDHNVSLKSDQFLKKVDKLMYKQKEEKGEKDILNLPLEESAN